MTEQDAVPRSRSRVSARAKLGAILTIILGLFLALAVTGCGVQQQDVKPTPQVVKQVGLPTYPNAKPLFARTVTLSSGLGKSVQLIVAFQTPDDISAVERFYARVLPKTAMKQTITIAGVQTTTYTQTTTSGSRQIVLAKMPGSTLIQLQNMTLNLGNSAPSGTPPSGTTPNPSAPAR